jgi:hypothetical protein
MRIVIAAALPLTLGGCIASTALDVVTLPVKAAGVAVDATSGAVDAVTTSQSEADEKRGRELRKTEERAGREARRQAEERREWCEDASQRERELWC